MFIVFHDGEIWDQYETPDQGRTDPIPIYALCYSDETGSWWMWYHSWNNITKDIETGGRELPPIAKAFLLIAEG
jgi:hypothetical protein